jgi:hypothetical protein
VLGNQIGDTGGSGVLGNGGHGIHIACVTSCGTTLTTVGQVPLGGGPCGGDCNTIIGNGGAGIRIDDDASTGNAIGANAVFGNGGLGIDLGPGGVTPNDDGDADDGANLLQNFPVIDSADFDGQNTTIAGRLNSTASTTFSLAFYDNSGGPDPSGVGEGQAYLGSTGVTTDASGNGTFQFVASGPHGFITATSLSPAGNSSEFSAVYANPGEASPVELRAGKGDGTAIQLTYAPSCAASDHVVYLGGNGPSAIAALSFTSSFCAVGASGFASIDPGDPADGSFFYFVIVGQNATREGSYGWDSTDVERPEAVGVGACDLPQGLGTICP